MKLQSNLKSQGSKEAKKSHKVFVFLISADMESVQLPHCPGQKACEHQVLGLVREMDVLNLGIRSIHFCSGKGTSSSPSTSIMS